MGGKKQRIIPGVRVVDLGAKGKAIGRTPDGEIVLVERAVPGDVATVRVVKKRKGMKVTVPVEYEQKSAERVDPVCAHFGTCGGCKWQNLSYAAQLHYKEKAVRDALQRIGGVKDADVAPILGSPTTEYSRMRAG
jgi:23S rRNA (uracil1939-C5)-methyltransferase